MYELLKGKSAPKSKGLGSITVGLILLLHVTTNKALKAKNSELTLQVPSLQLENAELQLTVKTLESRTPQELLAGARARNATSLKTS